MMARYSKNMTLKRVLGAEVFASLKKHAPKNMAAFVRESVRKALIAMGEELAEAKPRKRGPKPKSIFNVKRSTLYMRKYRARIAKESNSVLEDRILHEEGPSRPAHAIRVPLPK